MWVVGCIDYQGSISARAVKCNGDVMHRKEESKGTRWRWNVWGQEFIATFNPSHNKLSSEELALVTEWLERKGFKNEP